jgi:6-phosphofructokinase 2
MNIVTLTLNPALDKSTQTHRVVPEDKLRCAPTVAEPGGGGLNVARVIRNLGGEALAIYTAGGLTGESLKLLVEQAGLAQIVISIGGETRESFTVYEESSTREYRFNMPGPLLQPQEWQACLDAVAALSPPPDFLVASGSLPPGVPEDFYIQAAALAEQIGAKAFIDTSGPALAAVMRNKINVFLLKPNLKELSDLTGRQLRDDEEQIAAARQVIEQGCCGAIVVSLGRAGVLFVTNELVEWIRAPAVPIKSKIGAGDSMVAGIVLALARGASLQEAVRFGVAAGSAAVMTSGADLARRHDAEHLYDLIRREHPIRKPSHRSKSKS